MRHTRGLQPIALVLVCISVCAVSAKATLLTLDNSTVNISWWDGNELCCPSLASVFVTPGATVTNFAGLFDITFQSASVDVRLQPTTTFTTFHELLFLLPENLFAQNISILGTGPSQIGFDGWVFTPSLGGWVPQFSLGFGPNGRGVPYTLDSGTSFSVDLSLTSPPSPPPPFPTTPEPSSIVLLMTVVGCIFWRVKKHQFSAHARAADAKYK